MSRKGLLIIDALILLLALTLLFTLSGSMTAASWITLGFAVFSFLSSILFQTLIWNSFDDKDSLSYKIPGIAFSNIYIVLQVPICLLMGLNSTGFSIKTTVLFNGILAIICWILIVGSITGTSHARKVNSRQKDHHVEL